MMKYSLNSLVRFFMELEAGCLNFPVVGNSLCDLSNKSLPAGKFPEDWKVAPIAEWSKG